MECGGWRMQWELRTRAKEFGEALEIFAFGSHFLTPTNISTPKANVASASTAMRNRIIRGQRFIANLIQMCGTLRAPP